MGVVCPRRRPQAKQKLVSTGLRLPHPEQMSAEPAAAALVTAAPQRWQKAAPSATTPPHWKQVNIGIQAERLSHPEPAGEEKRKD
jgi:hypothetical protein